MSKSERKEKRERTVDEVGSDVDNDSSRLKPRTLNEARLTDGSDDNVGLSNDLLEVLSARVALGYGRVLSAKKGADGRTDDVGTTEDDGVLATDVDAGRLEEEHDTSGGARGEERGGGTGRKKSDVVGVEAVSRRESARERRRRSENTCPSTSFSGETASVILRSPSLPMSSERGS
jgi:hypothetical protein